MSDTLITVVAIVLAASLIFVVPLMAMADRVDTSSQSQVEAIVSEFVEEIRTTHKITPEKYNKFLQDLSSLGYTFDVSMEARILDENPGKKTLQTAKDKVGENGYISDYTTQIEDKLNYGDYILNTGDMILVTVKNTNLTFAQQMKQFMYKIVGNDSANIVASKAGMMQ